MSPLYIPYYSVPKTQGVEAPEIRFAVHGKEVAPARYLEEVQALAEQPEELANHLQEDALARVCSADYLMATLPAARRGNTPGPNGHRWDTYGYGDWFAKCGEIEFCAMRGEFDHQRTRRKPIEKPAGGVRTLRIPNVEVRLQQRALLDFLQSAFDVRFAPCNWGFRPGRSRLGAMAEVAERLVRQPELYVLIADVKDAFDSVPIPLLEEKLREWVIDERIVKWASTLTRNTKRKGLGQGGPLSPFLLNVLLHHVLDIHELPPGVVRFRYADDLLLLAPSPEALSHSSELIQLRLRHIGMQLKDSAGDPWRADARPTTWLGFEFLVADGKLHFTIPEGAWFVLENRLNGARTSQKPGIAARNIVHGWIPQFASVLSCDSEAEYAKLLALLERTEFDGEFSPAALKRQWNKSRFHFLRLCAEAHDRLDG